MLFICYSNEFKCYSNVDLMLFICYSIFYLIVNKCCSKEFKCSLNIAYLLFK